MASGKWLKPIERQSIADRAFARGPESVLLGSPGLNFMEQPRLPPEFAVAPAMPLLEVVRLTQASSSSFCAPPALLKNTAALP